MQSFHQGNPYDIQLVPPPGDGPANYSPLLLGTNMVVANETPPEWKARLGGTAKLAVVNPEYVSNKRLAVGSMYGEGWGYHNDAAYRNRTRKIKSDLDDFNMDKRLQLFPDAGTQSPMTTPNVIPADYFSHVKHY